MVKASGVAVELDLEAIPVLAGALETLELGITSSLQTQNLRASNSIRNLSEVSTLPKYPLLFDPQTAGGLLGAIASEQADSCLATLTASGYSDSRIIGRVIPTVEGIKSILIQ
jgi:selenide,water dikinase